MATRAAIKANFETGDKPTQAQFSEWIDSDFNFDEDTTDDIAEGDDNKFVTPIQKGNINKIELGIACSDETTDLEVATPVVTFRMPFAMTLTGVRASVNSAPVGSTLIIDINEGGTTILSTKLSIDAWEKTSTTAAVPPVISDTGLADDAEITIDIDQIGASTAGTGLKVFLIGTRT